MKVLVSFCNRKNTDGPDLAVYDPDNLSHRFVKLPDEFRVASGVTGLASAGGYLYVVPQISLAAAADASIPFSVLLTFKLATFSLIHRYAFRCARDVHSICATTDTLYAASSGTDEVLRLQLRDGAVVSEEVCWRPDATAPREDIHHLNSVLWSNGQLLVSGFGKKAGQRWETANQGFIYNISHSRTVTRGVDHPHSLVGIGDSIAYCESRKMRIGTLDNRGERALDGYSRGLCRIENHLFAASSIGRCVSRSLNVINNPADPGEPLGRCTINRLRLDNFEVEATTDLTAHGSEIYDLLPIRGPVNWPFTDEFGKREAA